MTSSASTAPSDLTRGRERQSAEALADAVDAGVRVSTQELVRLRHAAGNLPLNAMRIRAAAADTRASPFKGRGMEFEESRPYQPGDDLRSLDWRVMARTGKPYTKLFREERERPVLLWVDLRRSMLFATRGAFKAVLAARLAAAVAWSALRQGDRVGGLVFCDNSHDEVRPSRGKGSVMRLIDTLGHHSGWSADLDETPVDLEAAAARLRRVARPGSLVFLLSDFYGLTDMAVAHLQRTAAHCDVVQMQFYDPLERELPQPGLYRLQSGGESLTLDTADGSRRRAYQARFDTHCGEVEDLARRLAISSMRCATDDDPIDVVRAGLGLRAGGSASR
ncbi:MAG: DUF58 domain-containing protein [Pseudomonadota bacterium]